MRMERSASVSRDVWAIQQHIGAQITVLRAVATALLIVILMYVSVELLRPEEALPVVNSRFRLEPRVFARLRWAFNSKQILKDADKKVLAPRQATIS